MAGFGLLELTGRGFSVLPAGLAGRCVSFITDAPTRDVLFYPAEGVTEVATANVPTLDVYLSTHCFGCAEALRLAAAATQQFPAVAVRVVDLDQEPQARPDGLVGVPTYVLEGRVIALGNPRQRDLFVQLERSLAGSRPEGR